MKFTTNALTAVGVLMTLIDFTLPNARRFYSSMGNPLAKLSSHHELVKSDLVLPVTLSGPKRENFPLL